MSTNLENELNDDGQQGTNNALQATLVRLILAFYGQDGKLDAQIDHLQNALIETKGTLTADLQKGLNDVVDTIIWTDFLNSGNKAESNASGQLVCQSDQPSGDLSSMQTPSDDYFRPHLYENLANAVHTLANELTRFLDRPSLAPDIQQQLRETKDILLDCDSSKDFESMQVAIFTLIKLVQTDIKKEMDGLGHYLSYVTTKLQDLHQHITQTFGDRKTSIDDVKALKDSTVEQLGYMSTELNAMSYTPLRVRDKLHGNAETIENIVSNFVDAETARHLSFEDTMAHINDHIKKLEEETRLLSKNINERKTFVTRDDVTRLPNSRVFEQILARRFAQWLQDGGSVSFILIDLDDFSEINDSYGRPTGDKALRTIAEVIRKMVRSSDFVSRYNKDQFALLLPTVTVASAEKAAEKLRKTVEKCVFMHNSEPLHITISCGITGFQEGDTPNLMVERAENNLQQAKQSGKNQCCTGFVDELLAASVDEK